MSERDIGLEILEGINEIKEFKLGKRKLETREVEMTIAPKAIRDKSFPTKDATDIPCS
jgi:putative transcriptional regulator